jgi:hypothetical protein
MRLAPWDVRLAARTLALAVVTLVAIALIEWFTSERGAATGTTGAAIGPLPLAPVAAAVAVSIALVPARSSGELRALAAMGASPLRARLAALLVAAALGLVAAYAVGTGRVDATPLYPSARPPSDWRVDAGAGASASSASSVGAGDPARSGAEFVSARRRARLAGDRFDRDPTLPELPRPEGLPAHGRGAAALAIALAAVALATFASSPLRRRPLRSILGFALYGASQVAAFQIVGARMLPAAAVVIPPAALLLLAMLELHGERRLSADEAWL